MTKYLDSIGVGYVWNKVKNLVSTSISSINKRLTRLESSSLLEEVSIIVYDNSNPDSAPADAVTIGRIKELIGNSKAPSLYARIVTEEDGIQESRVIPVPEVLDPTYNGYTLIIDGDVVDMSEWGENIFSIPLSVAHPAYGKLASTLLEIENTAGDDTVVYISDIQSLNISDSIESLYNSSYVRREDVDAGRAVPVGGTEGQVLVHASDPQTAEWKNLSDLNIPSGSPSSEPTEERYNVLMYNIAHHWDFTDEEKELYNSKIEEACKERGISTDNTYKTLRSKFEKGIPIVPYIVASVDSSNPESPIDIPPLDMWTALDPTGRVNSSYDNTTGDLLPILTIEYMEVGTDLVIRALSGVRYGLIMNVKEPYLNKMMPITQVIGLASITTIPEDDSSDIDNFRIEFDEESVEGYTNVIGTFVDKRFVQAQDIYNGTIIPKGGKPGQVLARSDNAVVEEFKWVDMPGSTSNTERKVYPLGLGGPYITNLPKFEAQAANGINIKVPYNTVLQKIKEDYTIKLFFWDEQALEFYTIPGYGDLLDKESCFLSLESITQENIGMPTEYETYYMGRIIYPNGETSEQIKLASWADNFSLEENPTLSFTYLNSSDINQKVLEYIKGQPLTVEDSLEGKYFPTGSAGQVLVCDGSSDIGSNASWKDVSSIIGASTIDLLSYGVRFSKDVMSSTITRVGNLTYHKTLPIQSKMKGCIFDVVYNTVRYWLDEDDWDFIKNGKVITSAAAREEGGYVYIDFDLASLEDANRFTYYNDGLNYVNHVKKLKVDDIIVTNFEVQTTDALISIKVSYSDANITILKQHVASANSAGNKVNVEFGSCLDGCDGEVMVYVPGFYIKSFEDDNYYEVRISDVHIDDTWEYQPARYVGAYKGTVVSKSELNSLAHKDLTYLSKLLEIDSVDNKVAVTIANSEILGGDKTSTTSSLGYNNYGKPSTNISRNELRTILPGYGLKYIMSYYDYKNIMYWLYVIEYANPNVQASGYSSTTTEGYKRGGLGYGITTVTNWENRNNKNPLTINGATNSLCNGSGQVYDRNTKLYPVRWRGIENPFGDIYQFLDGISAIKNSNTALDIRITNDKQYFTDKEFNIREYYKELYQITSTTDSYISSFDCKNNAHLIPVFNNLAYSTVGTCDNLTTGDLSNIPMATSYAVVVGGKADDSDKAGLSCMYLNVDGKNTKANNIGFRLVIQLPN